MQLTIDQAYLDLLEQARELSQHAVVDRHIVEVQRALQALVKSLRARKAALAERPRSAPERPAPERKSRETAPERPAPAWSRHVPAQVRRARSQDGTTALRVALGTREFSEVSSSGSRGRGHQALVSALWAHSGDERRCVGPSPKLTTPFVASGRSSAPCGAQRTPENQSELVGQLRSGRKREIESIVHEMAAAPSQIRSGRDAPGLDALVLDLHAGAIRVEDRHGVSEAVR